MGPSKDGESIDPTTRCDNCGLPLPGPPVFGRRRDREYRFCSESCRAAFGDDGSEATVVHHFERRSFGVAALDDQLPEGFARNSFVLLSSVPGTDEESLHAELVWRTLRRGEPVVVVAFEEPPFAIVEALLSMEWNVIPYLESGLLRFVDCFSERVTTYREDPSRLTDWSRYVSRITATVTERVADFTSFAVLHDHLDAVVKAVGAYDSGLVLVDSLDELATIQPTNALPFARDLRADFCKGRYVPVVGGATYVFEDAGFPQNLRYFADGIVETNLERPDGDAADRADGTSERTGDDVGDDAALTSGERVHVPGDRALRRTVTVLKMQGVVVESEPTPYEYERGVGLVATSEAS